MGKWTIGPEMTKYINNLNALAEKSTPLMKRALYTGMEYLKYAVADYITLKLPRFPTCNKEIANALADSVEVSKMKVSAYGVHTRIAMVGYFDLRGKNFPCAYMAHIINSGTTKQRAFPWINAAFKSAETEVNNVIGAALDAAIDKEFNK